MEEEVYRTLYAMEDEHWWFRGRRAVLWAMLRRAGIAGPGLRVLDAGCGTGRNLAEFGRLGEIHGVDPSDDAIAFCRRRGFEGVLRAGLEALPFDDERFDLIVASDVLEHIKADDAALAELRRVAAPGARLVVTVPAYEWLWSPHDDSHRHVRRYTLPQLRRRARAQGWEPELATYFNSLLLAPIAAVRLLTRGRAHGGRSDYELTGGPLNAALERPMRAEARLIERGGRLPAGVSVGMVLRPA